MVWSLYICTFRRELLNSCAWKSLSKKTNDTIYDAWIYLNDCNKDIWFITGKQDIKSFYNFQSNNSIISLAKELMEIAGISYHGNIRKIEKISILIVHVLKKIVLRHIFLNEILKFYHMWKMLNCIRIIQADIHEKVESHFINQLYSV